MCGIIGILGRAPVAEQLVDSLKRLEYRGYDSAGVATLEGDHLDRRRAEGKLKNLEARLKAEPLAGHAGTGDDRLGLVHAPEDPACGTRHHQRRNGKRQRRGTRAQDRAHNDERRPRSGRR